MSDHLAVSDISGEQRPRSRPRREWSGSPVPGRASAERTDARVVLERIARDAVEVLGTETGAIALVTAQGDIAEFIAIGFSDRTDGGANPPARAILDVILEDPRPIRVNDLTDAPVLGLLSGISGVGSVLAAPILIGDEVLGVLYVGNHASGPFGDADERVLVELAATAALVVDHGRLREETARRREWAATSAEVAFALVSNAEGEAMDLFVDRLLHLADADFVALLQVSQVTGSLVVNAVRGLEEEALQGAVLPAAKSFARSVLEGTHPLLIGDCVDAGVEVAQRTPLGPAMAIPLLAPRRAEAVLFVARVPGAREFTPTDLEMTADFAELATVALELAAPAPFH